MAEASDCIICLEPVAPSPSDYDTYSIMQDCVCLYTAHPACIAAWVHANKRCVICAAPAAVGMRQSVIRALTHQSETLAPRQEYSSHDDNQPVRRPRDTSCCCTIL